MASPSPRGSRFRVTWLLQGELAVGPAPLLERHLDRLEQEGVGAVLSLSAEAEAPPPASLAQRFHCARLVLPDHRQSRAMGLEELEQALALLEQLHGQAPVFVHCVAAAERSPMVCMAWLVRQHQLSPQQALEYLLQVHPGTNPLPQQLQLLRQLVP